jgi:hypothetical protein
MATRIRIDAPVRAGLWLLGAAGLVCTAIFVDWMVAGGPSPETDPQAFADYSTSLSGVGSGLVYLVGLVLLLFGVLALYSVLAHGSQRRLALAGLVAQVTGICALLAALGASVLAVAVVGKLYQQGQTGVVPALDKFQGGSFDTVILFVLLSGLVLSLLGAIASGVALWHSGAFPKWLAVAFGLGLALFATSAPPFTMIGGVLLAVVSFGLQRALRAEAPAAALEARHA